MGRTYQEDELKELSRAERLTALRDVLANAINECDSKRDLAALSKQYRETLRELEEIEGKVIENDEIGELLASRAANGLSGAVR